MIEVPSAVFECGRLASTTVGKLERLAAFDRGEEAGRHPLAADDCGPAPGWIVAKFQRLGISEADDIEETKRMKKFTFLLGMTIGFFMGSRSGRGPYAQLERVVRQAMDRSGAQNTFQSAINSIESIRKTAFDESKGAVDGVSNAATTAIDETSKAG